MADYVSVRSIMLKNKILTPQVLDLYRSGDLNFSNIAGTIDPLEEVYTATYSYIDFPELSTPAKNLVQKALRTPREIALGLPIPLQPNLSHNSVTPEVRSVPGTLNGLPATYGPMYSPRLSQCNYNENNSGLPPNIYKGGY
jgi:hypothetical protein